MDFKDKTILITGGTGSFGRAFTKRLLQEDAIAKLIIFSRDEWKQWEMRDTDPIFTHPKIRYFLGDIRDPVRLARAFHEVDIVIHAAALKQVPAAEYNPSEFIKTNVMGAMNIINAAIDAKVEKVIALSTDKAVNPVNLYGATKLCSDKLFIAGNAYVGSSQQPIFAVVRYGNVLGSRGSLLPFWKKLIAQGETSLPVTDPRMTRFWITLDEAVNFVIHCLPLAQAGEIFVPKIPSIKITDLAEALGDNLTYHTVGIRPGEKLHELMIGPEDARHTREFSTHYAICPELAHHGLTDYGGTLLPDGFAYTSDTNPSWLTGDALKKYVHQRFS